MFDYNYSEMDVAALKGLLTKRLVALHIVTEDFGKDRVKAAKDSERSRTAFENAQNVIPERSLLELLSMGRAEEHSIRRHLKHLKGDKSGDKKVDDDLRKRAEQVILISSELHKRGETVPEIDISKFHPRIQQAFRAEFAKLGVSEQKVRRQRKLKAPKKARARRPRK